MPCYFWNSLAGYSVGETVFIPYQTIPTKKLMGVFQIGYWAKKRTKSGFRLNLYRKRSRWFTDLGDMRHYLECQGLTGTIREIMTIGRNRIGDPTLVVDVILPNGKTTWFRVPPRLVRRSR